MCTLFDNEEWSDALPVLTSLWWVFETNICSEGELHPGYLSF